jgi:hypothetical protein
MNLMCAEEACKFKIYQSNPSNSPDPLRAEVSWIDHCRFLMSGNDKASETWDK